MAHASIERAKTHCPQGHPYSKENTHLSKKGGGRTCKMCACNRVKKKRLVLVKELSKYKLEKGCETCGYNKCAAVLGFHHRDPTQKIGQIPNMFSYSKERREAEIAKCVLLCANCHLEEHARLREEVLCLSD